MIELARRATRGPYVLGLVAATLVAGLTAATALRPAPVAEEEPPRAVVPVSSAALVCADPSVLGEGSTTDVTFGSPDLSGGDGSGGDGAGAGDGSTADAGSLDPDEAAFASLDRAGPVAALSPSITDADPVVVRALGALAPGLTATQLTRATEGDVRGLAAVACTEPGTSAWFAGLGTEIGHRPRLVLVNAEQAPAELDIRLFGPAGEVVVAASTDVVVPARSALALELDALAPDLPQLAVQVTASSGQVVSAIRDYEVDGLLPHGVDWVPASDAPALRAVLPGVPAGGGERRLQLVTPGDLDARVEVRLLTPTGAITPTGLEEVDLPAGEVREIDLTEVVAGEAVAVELTSDQPVVAGLRVGTGAADGVQELAYTAAAVPLDGPAMATEVRRDDGYAGRLLLSAGAGSTAASVLVTYTDPRSGAVVATDRVEVAPGTTVDLALDAEAAPDRFAVTVTPTGGELYAVLQLVQAVGEDETFLGLLQLRSPRLAVEVPRVRHDLSTGLRPAS